MKRASLVLLFIAAVCGRLSAQAVVTDSLEFDKGVCSTPDMMLTGKAAGVRVSAIDNNPVSGVHSVNIRGINSLRGNSEPLWIVDGAVMPSSSGYGINAFWQEAYADYGFMPAISEHKGLNLYDIESIRILKSTSATAMYGSRGANGVIIINTHKPLNKKKSFEWNSNVALNGTNNHNIVVGAVDGRTLYRLSAFIRHNIGPVNGNKGTTCGLRMMFDTKANSVIQFGLNSALSLGNDYSQLSTSWYGTPVMIDGYTDKARMLRTTNSFHLDFNFLPWLKWTNTASADYSANTRYLWYRAENEFGSQQNGAEGIVYTSLLNTEYSPALDFDFYFSQHHHINARIGGELVYKYARMNTMNGVNFFIKDLGLNSFNIRESKDSPAFNTNKFLTYAVSGQFKYDYKNYVGVDVLFRTDRNNRYDDKFQMYPAGNMYVDLHEILLKKSKSVSALKLKAGYGVAGDLCYIPYKMFGNYTGGPYTATSTETEAFFEGCRKLTSGEYNAGIEFGFLQDRISVSVEWYRKTTDDALYLYCFGQPKDNGIWKKTARQIADEQCSSILNTGIEATISAGIVRVGKFRWDADMNFTFNQNKILQLAEGDVKGLQLNPIGLTANRNIAGQSISILYGFIHDNQDKIIGEGILGTTIPKYSYGITNTLRYGPVILDFLIDGAAGFSILNMNRMSEEHALAVSDKYVERGDYVRLSRVSLKYEIPLKRIDWMHSLAVSLTGSNLATISQYSGKNPDINSFGMLHSGYGIDYGGYPYTRSVMFGISAKF